MESQILSESLLFAGVTGAGLGALACAIAARPLMRARGRRMEAALRTVQRGLDLAGLAAESFDQALIAVEDQRPTLVSGAQALASVAERLGVPARAPSVIEALAAASPEHDRALRELFTNGAPFRFTTGSGSGSVRVEGRASGVVAWVCLVPAPAETDQPARPDPGQARVEAFIEAYGDPAWIADAQARPLFANRAWLKAVGAADLAQARAKGASIDTGADAVIRLAAAAGTPSEKVRWTQSDGARRALLVRATPLGAGEVGVWTTDVTQGETIADSLRRHITAQEAVLDRVSDAVAIFGRDRRLAFSNEAFANLWGLEPAWLEERPFHAAWLDRLRQLGRLPETPDYAAFRAAELARHERLRPDEPALWRLPGERTLKVTSHPHPAGGIILVFSDITPELRLQTQFNHLIQVQKATLDKLADAVAVFGADGRLKLHNEAFAALWSVPPEAVERAATFDGVVELAERRLSNLAFWRDLKGRITSADPIDRAPASGEQILGEGRILAWQSRPLPDGATLIGFTDVTDARSLEGAVADKEAALVQSERLKRDFVANVSHQLRDPLTAVLGYAERLERGAEGPVRAQAAAIRRAGDQLARLIGKVLDIAQLDAGELPLKLTPTRLGPIAREAMERWGVVADEAGVILERQGDPQEPVMADAERLGQTLDYLLENALRHTPSGGRVTVRAERDPVEARLIVRDEGRGIPFHVQAHIFDRFRADGGAGPGLGLALAKGLVELHGGWVALESEPGAGATVTCHLPAALH